MLKQSRGIIHTTIPRHHVKHAIQSALADVGIVLLAYIAAFSARAVSVPLDFIQGTEFFIFAIIIIVGSLYVFGVYHRIWSRTSGHGITVIISAVLAATVVMVAFTLLLEPRPIPLSVVLLGNTLSVSGLIAVRFRSRLISGASWRWRVIWNHEFPKAKTHALIVGAGESGQILAWRMKHRFPSNDLSIVGFIDDDKNKQGMYIEGVRVLAGREDIPRLVEAYDVDLIIVSIHNIPGPEFRAILSFCERTKARIKVIPDVFEHMNAKTNTVLLRDVQAEDLLGRSIVSRHEAVDLTPIVRKVIMVTGAAGSIGSELCRQIMDYDPLKVIVVDNNESGLHDLITELESKFPKERLIPVLADISVDESIKPVFARYNPEIIFHAAAYKHVPMLEYHPNEALRVNVGGTLRLAELARAHHVERFVLISTDKAVNPSSVMGASKHVCEVILHALSQQGSYTGSGTNGSTNGTNGNHASAPQTLFTSVRFGNVLGSRGSVVPTFTRQIDVGGPVTVTHPNMTRYFMSTAEAVNLVIHAACLTNGDDIFILKMGEVVRIVDLAERMIRLRGLRPYEDIDIKFTHIRPGEKMHEELYDTLENPVETLHPNIIKLNTWTEANTSAFNAPLFLQHVRRLLKEGFDSGAANGSEPLAQLHELTAATSSGQGYTLSAD
ncbi:MAG: polysaccharide biosynthesis protein [Burkholderiales bacterium]|nr:polysaccharide biosynthesis protein [Anaerolineae bacterium]